MPITLTQLLDDCMNCLGLNSPDSTFAWDRTDQLYPWAIETIREFPILRPRYYEHTSALAAVHIHRLPDDFREVISVEYPYGEDPPIYWTRFSHFDTKFHSKDDCYDIDHDFSTGNLWMIYFSHTIAVNTIVHIEYLANHDVDIYDDGVSEVTVPNEYEEILITGVMCKAYRERLTHMMSDPTTFADFIAQFTVMVKQIEDKYTLLIAEAQAKLSQSKILPKRTSDKFDKVY